MALTLKEVRKKHKPIDYDTWDYSGKGMNILHLLTPLEKDIWFKAFDFQDKRDDKGHAEIATYFSLKLLPYHPSADRDVVVITDILHDTGWGLMTDEERALFPNYEIRKIYDPIMRLRHQELGRDFADKILKQVGYVEKIGENGEQKKEHILEIISQHDTRPGFYSLNDQAVNDGVVRDADKLWRPTLIALQVEANRTKKSVEEIAEKEAKSFERPNFWYSPISKEIAGIELEQALKAYKKREFQSR